MADVLSTVEDLKTALNTTTLKSMGFWFSFWNNWFPRKEIADKIQTISRLSFTLCLSKFIYVEFAEFKNKKHIGEDYGPDSLKAMTISLERHCT